MLRKERNWSIISRRFRRCNIKCEKIESKENQKNQENHEKKEEG